MSSVDNRYNPAEIESKRYAEWLKEGLFHPSNTSTKPAFCIMIPPPNVTGSLHMGHAFNNTLQDILARFKRMDGFEVLWMPGTDHAGIATQNVVEKMLAKEGKKKEQLGRERFLERVWEWKKQSGDKIFEQLHRLGASCDWDRARFTMDQGLSEAVLEAFIKLYERGLVYRGEYIVNWCSRCTSAISDLEVNHTDEQGKLYHLRYKLSDDSGEIVIATTRPETIVADTAVAVHPDDQRYQRLKGQKIKIPLFGREIPIITDEYVDMAFGSGGLKVTPAHDVNDFEIGQRHSLPLITAIDERGKMTQEAGVYLGLDRFECRKKIVEDLESQGFIAKVEDHPHKVGRCQRCDTVIEPRVSKQWFVRTNGMAEKAMQAVRDSKTTIAPDNWNKVYFQWLENIRDWCISRQLWWGHRIPVYYCQGCQAEVAARETPKQCKCGSTEFVQDPDVLDTWFSSGLWPFSTLGWPEQSADLKKFFPTSVLITGFDILFFWVARMMMFSTELLDQIPFKQVYLHALVRDEHGNKMSKSKGNVLDPLVLIEKYGADAVRFTLTILAVAGRDVPLAEARIKGYQNFINKIWNATRFCLLNLEQRAEQLDLAQLDLVDRWIRSRMAEAIEQVRNGIESFNFNEVADAQYRFFWDEFCAWYVEACKISFKDSSRAAHVKANLLELLETSLKLMHPVVPFVTEELWRSLPSAQPRASIMFEPFPKAENFKRDLEIEREFDQVRRVVETIRNMKVELKLQPKAELDLVLSERASKSVMTLSTLVQTLCKLRSIKVGERPAGSVLKVLGELELYLCISGQVDSAEDRERLNKEILKLRSEQQRLAALLSDTEFAKKAPAHVIESNRERASQIDLAIKKIEEGLNR